MYSSGPNLDSILPPLLFYSISNRSFSPIQKARIPAFGVVVHGAFFRALFRAGGGAVIGIRFLDGCFEK